MVGTVMPQNTKKNLRISLFFFLFLGFAVLIPKVWAENGVNNLNDQLDEIKAKIKAYQDIIHLKQREGSALSDQIELLQAQAASLSLQIETNVKTLSELDSQISDLDKRIGEKEAVITVQKRVLSELMQNYYLERGKTSIALLTVGESTFNPFQIDEWMSQTGDRVREVLGTLKTLRQSLVDEEGEVNEKRNNADSLRLQLDERNDYLSGVESNKSFLLAKTQRDTAKYNALVDDLEKQREDIESEIESIDAGKIDSLDLKDMPKFKHGVLKYPLKSILVTQGYGKTSYAKKTGSYGPAHFHNGLDFGASTGTSILAAGDGKVVAVGNNGKYAYGKWVAIDHQDGIITLYGHMSKQLVKRGDSVGQGDTIGLVGSTGNATGPHLHFTVYSTKSFDVVPSSSVPSVKDIPVGATVNPSVYLP